jgi:hypothetical protein
MHPIGKHTSILDTANTSVRACNVDELSVAKEVPEWHRLCATEPLDYLWVQGDQFF